MIAHRLNTILFCDKVICLDQGRIVEYGRTSKLKNDPNSCFGGMLQKADDIEAALG